jgi:hypothetical protein
MAAKQKYEVIFNDKRKKYEVLKGVTVVLSSDKEESAINYMNHCRNYPFVEVQRKPVTVKKK